MTNHETYWKNRNNEILTWVDQQDIDVYKELQDVYSDFTSRIQKEIFKFYGKYADENGITYQQAKERLKGEDLSDYHWNAKRYFEEAKLLPPDERGRLLDRLNEQYRASQVRRLDQLHLDMVYQVAQMNTLYLQDLFAGHLLNIAEYSYLNAIEVKAAVNRPALEELVKQPFEGENYSQNLWGNTDDLVRKLKETFKKGFVKGLSVQQMSQEIRKDFNVKRAHADNLIRTDGTHIVTRATGQRYMDFGLARYKLNVKVDSRTTDICMRLHRADEVYLFKNFEPGVTAPPFHFSCRTGIIPDEDELLDEHWEA